MNRPLIFDPALTRHFQIEGGGKPPAGAENSNLKPQHVPSHRKGAVEELSWLKDPIEKREAPFNFKMFCLECADPFISETEHLEGERYSNTLPRFSETLGKALSFMREQGYSAEEIDTKPFEEAGAIAKEVEERFFKARKGDTASIREYAGELNERCCALKRGESLWIPGGWCGRPSGHAILYRLKKQENGDYSFTLFNTGAGLRYHDSIVVNGEERFQTHLEIENISKKKFTTPEFFQLLLEMQALPAADSSAVVSEKNLYIGAINYLNGKRVGAVDPEKFPELYLQPQRSGSCAMKSIFAMLHRAILDPDGLQKLNSCERMKRLQFYKTVKFFYTRQSLLESCSDYLNSGEYDRTKERMIAQVAAKWVRAANKLHNGGINPYLPGEGPILSEGLLQRVEATAEEIKEKLAAHKADHKLQTTSPLFSAEIDDAARVKSAATPLPAPLKGKEAEEKKVKEKKALTPTPLVAGNPADPKEVKGYLENLASALRDGGLEKGSHRYNDLLIRSIRRLPVPRGEEDLWSEIDSGEIVCCLKNLSELSRCCISKQESTPEQILTLNTLLAIADKLARCLPESRLTDSDLIGHYELLTFFHSERVLLEDPRDQARIIELLTYFDPKFDPSDRPVRKRDPLDNYEVPYAALEEERKKAIFAFGEEGEIFSISCDSDSDVRKNCHLSYLSRFLEGEEAREKLAGRGAERLELHKQVALLLKETPEKADLLPEAVHHLRQISYAAQAAARERDIADFSSLAFELEGNKERREVYRLHTLPNKVYFDPAYKNSVEASASKWYGISYSDWLDPNHFYDGDQNHFMGKYSLEKWRENCLINVNPEDEVLRTLSYFMSLSKEELEKNEEQWSLYVHLFRPGRLQPLIRNEPQQAAKLLNFVAGYFDNFIEVEKWQPAFFFASLGHKLQEQIAYLEEESPELFKGKAGEKLREAKRDYRKALLERIAPKLKTKGELCELYSYLSGMERSESFSVEELSEKEREKLAAITADLFTKRLLTGFAIREDDRYYFKGPVGETASHKRCEESAIEESVLQLLDKEGSFRDKILTAIVANMTAQERITIGALKWREETTYPFYETVDGAFSLDLAKGYFYREGKKVASLPRELLKDPIAQKLMPSAKEVRFLDEEGSLFEAPVSDGVLLLELSDDFAEEEPLAVLKQFGRDAFDKSAPSYRYIPLKLLPDVVKEAIPCQLLDGNDNKSSIWYCEEGKQRCFLIDPAEDGKSYTIRMKRDNDSNEMEVEAIYETGKEGRLLVDARRSEKFAALKAIEQPEKIFLWADAKNPGRLAEIELPRLNLHFSIKECGGELRAYCREVPGFYIESDSRLDYRGREESSLLLTNGVGERRALIPFGSYSSRIPSVKELYDPPLSHDKAGEGFALYPLKLEGGELRLAPASIGDALLLASQHLCKRRYRQAYALFNHLIALRPYSEKERAMIDKMIGIEDSHPSAILLRLKLAVVEAENRLKYRPKDKADAEKLKKLATYYRSYLANRSNTTLGRLTAEEEKTLLMELQSENLLLIPTLIDRLETLLHPGTTLIREGLKKATALDPSKKLEDSFGCEALFSYLEMREAADPDEIRKSPIAIAYRSKEEFRKLFPKLYLAARDGDSETKQYLKNVLRLMEGSDLLSNETSLFGGGGGVQNGDMIALACLLQKVMESPRKFPSREKLLEAEEVKRENRHEGIKRQIDLYKEIISAGENSRAPSLIKEVVEAAGDLIKLSKFYKPENIEELTSIDNLLAENSPPADFDTPLPIDTAVKARDEEWDAFFKGFLDSGRGYFIHEKAAREAPIPMEIEGAVKKGKRKELIDNLEKFYSRRSGESESFRFDESKKRALLGDICDKICGEVERFKREEGASFALLERKNRELFTLLATLKKPGEESSIEQSVEMIRKAMEGLLLLRELKVEELINGKEEGAAIEVNLKKLGKEKKKLTLVEAIALFEIGSDSAYSEITAMGSEERKALDREVGLYGIDKTRFLQVEKALLLLQKIDACPSKNGEKKLLEERLGEQMGVARSHLTGKESGRSRSYLRYEMKEGILLRPIQVELLEELLDRKEPLQLMEILGTGSGKTKILSPMKQWLRRKGGKRLLINVWPSQHYPVNREDVRRQVVNNYGERSDTIDFCRGSDISLKALKNIYRELARAINETRQVNATPESLQSLELKFLELLYDEAFEGISHPEGTIELFQKILKLLKGAEIHVDEGHINLSTKREVNFTVGTPAIEEAKSVELIRKVYELLTGDDLKEIVKLRSNEQQLLSDEQYDEVVAPKVAKEMASYLEIDKESYEEYREYVLGKAERKPEWLAAHPREREIALLRGELAFVLRNCLSKSSSVHYGLSKERKEIEYAKPYDANDSCVEKAEYDNAAETLNKTFQTYFSERLNAKKAWSFIRFLCDSAKEESARRPLDFPIAKTEAYQFFTTHFPKKLAEKNLFSLSERDVEKALPEINSSDTLIFAYVEKIVAPQIKRYDYKLKSDAENLRAMFNDINTMTATPGALESYGLEGEEPPIDKGNDFEVLAALNSKCSGNENFSLLGAALPREILSEVIAGLEGPDSDAHMLIDIGALFKGISNRSVAEAILEKTKGRLKGVAFYGDDNELMMLEEGGRLLPFEESQLRPDERFTYCDNKHMFGSDTVQPPGAKGICTFDTHVDLDDMLQGVGRLREFLKGQRAKWVATRAAMAAIEPAYSEKGSLFAIIRDHAIKNQEKKESDAIYRSIKQQMRGEIRALCMKKLREAPSDRAIATFRALKEFLVDEVASDPRHLYGEIESSASGAEALENVRKRLIAKVEASKEAFSEEELGEIRGKLEGYREKIEKLADKLPREVKEFNGELGTESEIQVQIEIENEQELETISNETEGLHNRKATEWPKDLDLFDGGEWHEPTSVALVTGKVQRTFFSKMLEFVEWFFTPTLKIIGFLKKIDRGEFGDPGAAIKKLTIAVVGIGTGIVATVNAIAFAIFGLPIFLALGVAGVAVEGFNLLFPRDKVVCEEAVAPTPFGVIAAKGAVKTPVPLYELGDIVKCHPDSEVSQAAELFADRERQKIRFTNNLLRKVPEDSSDVTVKALGKEQKPIHEILVIEEVVAGEKHYTVIAGDQSTDARFFRKALKRDVAETSAEAAKERGKRCCLFDLKLGVVQSGKEAIDEEELRENRDFQELLIKLKLFNAEVDYSEKEEELLIELAKDRDERKKMQKFLKCAVVFRDEKRRKLGRSRINHILSDLE